MYTNEGNLVERILFEKTPIAIFIETFKDVKDGFRWRIQGYTCPESFETRTEALKKAKEIVLESIKVHFEVLRTLDEEPERVGIKR